MKKFINKKISILIIVCFIFVTLGNYSFAMQGNSQFYFPENLAGISSSYDSGSNSMLYLIKDSHCDLDIQNKIYKIIEHIDGIDNYKSLSIGIEGGWGTLDTTFLKAIPDGQIKYSVLNKLFNDYQISGAEKFAINNNVELFGLEDEELYKFNYKIFHEYIVTYRNKLSYFLEKYHAELLNHTEAFIKEYLLKYLLNERKLEKE
ncbi:hypothetical protein ACFL4A_03825, partial [bacterium]